MSERPCPLPGTSKMRCHGPAPCGHCSKCKWPYDMHRLNRVLGQPIECPKL